MRTGLMPKVQKLKQAHSFTSSSQLLLLAWLHLSGSGLGVFAQCDAELPSGKTCGQEDFFMEADPEVSSWILKMHSHY